MQDDLRKLLQCDCETCIKKLLTLVFQLQDEKTIKTRIYGLQELTFTIKNAIDYLVSLLERIKK